MSASASFSGASSASFWFNQAAIAPPANPAIAPRKILNPAPYPSKARQIIKNSQYLTPLENPTAGSGIFAIVQVQEQFIELSKLVPVLGLEHN
jgi:hypothetical protein